MFLPYPPVVPVLAYPQEVLLMTAVETPMGTYPRALIRRSDVLAIDF